MTTAMLIGIVLALACASGLWHAWKHPVPRRWALVALNLLCAGLLYLLLIPPTSVHPVREHVLTVLTPGITAAQVDALPRTQTMIGLPGSEVPASVVIWPDLASALRAWPEVSQLDVIGGGLPARDRDAARGYALRFEAAPLPRGVVELDAPQAVAEGAIWRVSGRVAQAGVGRIELRDPADAVIDSAPLDGAGWFSLQAQARTAGHALFHLQLLDAEDRLIERVPVPLITRSGASLRALLLAGAPSAELKYLQRWARDAGIVLDSRILLSRAIAVNEGAGVARLDATTLAGTDLVVVDERAWAALAAVEKTALRAAVESGMGLLLRVTAPLDDALRDEWRAFGIDLQSADIPTTISLAGIRMDTANPVPLTRQSLHAAGSGLAPLLSSDSGEALGVRGNLGWGRVAALWLQDSYRLTLAGDSAAFGSLWADLFGTLARSQGADSTIVPDLVRADERAVICGLDGELSVLDPSATRSEWLTDAVSGCAAWWPAAEGWHELLSDDQRWPVYVHGHDQALALDRTQTSAATARLSSRLGHDGNNVDARIPWPRWPLFLAWLIATSLLWWLQRGARR